MARQDPFTESNINQHIITDTNLPEGPVNEVDTVVPVDAKFENKFGSVQNAYDEGFASAHGVRNETAETDGEVDDPENKDGTRDSGQVKPVGRGNPGLADG